MSHTCPRRAENGMDNPSSPHRGAGQNLDTSEPGHGLVGQPRGCTYCGSMDPEDFMSAVRAGAEVGPTDKSYKVYVKGIPNPDPDRIYMLSSSPHQNPNGSAVHHNDLTDEQRAAVGDPDSDFNRDRYFTFRTMALVEGKFYTGHLSREQGDEFRALYGDGRVNVGYPGHFYRPLYIPMTEGSS